MSPSSSRGWSHSHEHLSSGLWMLQLVGVSHEGGWGGPGSTGLSLSFPPIRIKRIRDKYEVELQELERSERKLQERCNELKGRLAELEGESVRLQGLLKHKEQEVDEIRKMRDELAQERGSLAEVIRQEFADRLVGTEEENKRLKAEMAEMRTRQRLELDRVVQEKDKELEEVHRRVKTAVLRKEESVSSLRRQYEAAVQRATRLEALLEQQRKQLLAPN